MRIIRLYISTLLLLGLGVIGLQAQESRNTTGGIASGDEGSVSYSVGQIVYQTHTGVYGSIAEGMQQPYEISIVTSIVSAKGIKLSVTAYPNPTIDNLTIEMHDNIISNLYFLLFDINGKLLQNNKIASKQESIIMNNLVPGIYFMKVIQDNRELKTFKIIKN